MVRGFFDVEGLIERLRTCPQDEKKDLWIRMKTLGTEFISNYCSKVFSFCEANI